LIFNSVSFLLFLALVVPLYWALPRTPRLWLVFGSSLVFYGFWRVEFVPLMLLSAVTDYLCSLRIHATSDPRRRRAYLGLSLFVNFGLLFYFKYLLFFAENVTGLLGALGFDIPPPQIDIILPLGISFYTFQTVSYTVDVYRGFVRPERNFILYSCYVTYFPQLVAGPILRAREVIHQLDRRSRFDLQQFALGVRRVLFGLFLKVVLADHIAGQVDVGFNSPVADMSAIDVWTLCFLFGFQIYFDFSAYSHIAIGCAHMMGIRFPENFNFPYLSTSPAEFWQRWHISLSSWIRDYLYLPLAGERARDRSTGGLSIRDDRSRRRRQSRAIFISWGLMGLWHGANWTFVFWGLYNGTLVYAHRRLQPLTRKLPPLVQSFGGWMVTTAMIMLSFVAFRAQNIGDAFGMYAKVLNPMLYLQLGLRENTYLQAAVVAVSIVAAWWFKEALLPALERNRGAKLLVQTAAYSVVFALVFVFLRPIRQFIYFQF